MMDHGICLALLLFLAIFYGANTTCVDKDSRCKAWAASKECASNPSYMLANCRKSCKKCDDLCINKQKDTECAEWKGLGFCARSSQWYGYMKDNCLKSCGFCKASLPEVCSDKHDTKTCSEWAKTGECSKNPDWMNINCKKSCNKCKETSSECKDIHKTEDCSSWAKQGECDKNPGWMHVNCKKSCNKCLSGGTGTGHGSIAVGPIDGGKDKTKDKSVTQINDEICGLRLKARVVGGVDAAFGDWPWQVGLARSHNPKTPFCGGSLINKQWIVTANHCFGRAGVSSIQPEQLVIILGDYDISKNDGSEVRIKASKIVRHEDYKVGSYNADIALVKLSKPVKYNSYIKPVCLPDEGENEVIGKKCTVTGWGRLQEGGKQATVLQEAKIPIISRKACSEAFGYASRLTDNMICAGLKEGGVDACQGDSGGPFVCRKGGKFQLTGVVSFGRGCARANAFGVYAKASNYVNWIKKKIKE